MGSPLLKGQYFVCARRRRVNIHLLSQHVWPRPGSMQSGGDEPERGTHSTEPSPNASAQDSPKPLPSSGSNASPWRLLRDAKGLSLLTAASARPRAAAKTIIEARMLLMCLVLGPGVG
jgi:hypothetical protein